MGKWGKFRALSNRDRLSLFLFSVLLPLVDAGLHIMGYRRFRAFLAAHPRDLPEYQGTETEAIEASRNTSYLVTVASRYGLFHPSCLRRSCRPGGCAARDQTTPQVKKRHGQLYAHAWIRLERDHQRQRWVGETFGIS
jgi:hypothetical protein